MIARREWLRKALVQGIAAWTAGSRSSMAQTAPAAKKGPASRYTVKKPSVSSDKDSPSTVADEKLSRLLLSIRDGHVLPGLIGAIVRGNRLAAIGVAGVRKLGSEESIRVTDLV